MKRRQIEGAISSYVEQCASQNAATLRALNRRPDTLLGIRSTSAISTDPAVTETRDRYNATQSQLNYDAAGCHAFNAHVKAELDRWWTKRYLAHWIPRIRLGLWMFANCYLVTKCVHEQGKFLAARDAIKAADTRDRRARRRRRSKGS